MACKGCSVGKATGENKSGCGSSCGCSSGGCNRMNTFDWLSAQNIQDVENYNVVEVSFKNGARKGFYFNPSNSSAITGDWVVVEASTGYDVGEISLSGDLVRLQIKKKKVKEESIIHSIIRLANERDTERLEEARSQEMKTMVRARAIVKSLNLEMKIGDVEYQGDKRKATFYYTAEGRVDFRELIRHYAKEFRVKIEMRQIGSRQESGRIGGLGSCGRELCCSTWLSSFSSVSTAAARYQNLAINQAKLSGQCGRLKCCLNFELDGYLEALDAFPKDADKLYSKVGRAVLIKTDVFKGLMYYMVEKGGERGKLLALKTEKVHEIVRMNAENKKPDDLMVYREHLDIDINASMDKEVDFESVNEVIELPIEKRRKKKRRNRGGNRRKNTPKGKSKSSKK